MTPFPGPELASASVTASCAQVLSAAMHSSMDMHGVTHDDVSKLTKAGMVIDPSPPAQTSVVIQEPLGVGFYVRTYRRIRFSTLISEDCETFAP